MISKMRHYLIEDQKKLIVFIAMFGLIVFNIIFFFVPLVYGIIGSFYDWNPLMGKMDFIGMKNYVKLAASSLFTTSLKNTLQFSLMAIVLRTTLGLLIAVGIHALTKLKDVLRSAYFLPVIMPIVAISLVWKWIYHPRMGLLNMVLAAFGFVSQNWLGNPDLAMPSIIMMTVWKDTGYAVIIFMAALLNVPKSLYEAASIDGANGVKQFFHITVPTIKPTIIFIVITSIISYFQSFIQIFIMTKGGPGDTTHVLSYMIFNEAFNNYRFGYASALSVVLFLIIMLVTFIQFKVMTKGEDK